MKPSQLQKWMLGLLALAVIYASVAWLAPHLVRRAPAIKPGLIIHQHDADELSLVLPEGQQLDVIRIVAGDFVMGSPENEKGHKPNESPQHHVHIAHDFYLGKYVVTQAQWIAVMGKNPAKFQDQKNLPVEQVSWEDCQEFCKRVSHLNGRIVRLPTEAEWEFACRSGGTSVFAAGDSLSSTHANFDGRAPYGDGAVGPNLLHTTPVNFFAQNAWGLYDIHGNVLEWCADAMHPDYNDAPVDGSAWEAGGDSAMRACRGGSYASKAEDCRSAARTFVRQNTSDSTIGFRIAADLSLEQ